MTSFIRAPFFVSNALHALLSPKAIAILGATPNFKKVNGRPMKHLLDKGYEGKLYPVNPKYREIGGLQCFPRIGAIRDRVDLAVVAIPAHEVPGAISELGESGVPAAVVLSSGFSELGAAGRALEIRLTSAARAAGVRVCGPNCMGLINSFDKVLATFSQYAEGETPPGPVGFVTQSGAFGTAIAALARRRGLGIGYLVNTGNECDVDFTEVMGEILADARVRVVAGYIEGLEDGRGLTEVAAAAMDRAKPLVIVKVGRSQAGARAAASHTGSLAGEDRVFDGVARQFGIVRPRNEEHMLDIVEVFVNCPLPRGSGVGLVTMSGGAGVLMADRAEELGLEVPVLHAETQEALKAVLPDYAAVGNPVDVTGQFLVDPPILRDSVLITLSDPQVDVGIVWLQLMEAHVEVLCGILAEIKARATKPFVLCWVAAPEEAIAALREKGIAVLRGAEPGVDAVAALVGYAKARRRWLEDTTQENDSGSPAVFPAAGGRLSTEDAASILASFGVPLAQFKRVHSAEEAVAAATALSYPVAMKVESPDVLHKTEVKGVRLNLRDAEEVIEAFHTIQKDVKALRPGARIAGATVQEMISGDLEFAVGLHDDPVFGVMIMAGFGGIYVEVMQDTVFRKAPVTLQQALGMLEQLRAGKILDGARGRAPISRQKLAQFICSVSHLGAAGAGRLKELDLNPVIVGAAGPVAVDCVMVLADRGSRREV